MKHHEERKKRIQFILKRREHHWCDDDDQYSSELSSGLLNSVHFIEEMIELFFPNYEVEISQVHDANGIDRVVHHFKPDIVVIEAIWVPPYKFHELSKLHPRITWVIRLHSEMPFIANEGIAFDWLNQYCQHTKIRIAANSQRMQRELSPLLNHSVIYFPNFYEIL